MKKMLHNNEEYIAEKIVRTSTSITGYNGDTEVFTFRGVKDFSKFRLEEGQEWDISKEERQESTIAGLAYELVAKDLAIQTMEATQAEAIYQLMVKGVI